MRSRGWRCRSARSPSPPVAGRILDARGLPVPHATVHVVAADDNGSSSEPKRTPTDYFSGQKLSAKVRVVAEDEREGYVEER